MADDFFTRQLPHNVTWALTLLYALDSKGEFSDTAVQVPSLSPCDSLQVQISILAVGSIAYSCIA